MKFWASTAFMRSDELIDVARMLDDAGYHGVMVSDHVCYPRELKSPYPYSPHDDGRPIWDMRASAFSCPTIAAGLPLTVMPACDSVSLPPV